MEYFRLELTDLKYCNGAGKNQCYVFTDSLCNNGVVLCVLFIIENVVIKKKLPTSVM